MTGVKRLRFVAIVVVGLGAGCSAFENRDPGSLVLRFRAFMGEEPLVLNHMRYANPGGEGAFTVRDFRLYPSFPNGVST